MTVARGHGARRPRDVGGVSVGRKRSHELIVTALFSTGGGRSSEARECALEMRAHGVAEGLVLISR